MTEDINKLKKMIQNALADGRLSRAESEMIKKAIYEDNIVTSEEAQLWRELQQKVMDGEILLDGQRLDGFQKRIYQSSLLFPLY